VLKGSFFLDFLIWTTGKEITTEKSYSDACTLVTFFLDDTEYEKEND
jgi:hypothetical protein